MGKGILGQGYENHGTTWKNSNERLPLLSTLELRTLVQIHAGLCGWLHQVANFQESVVVFSDRTMRFIFARSFFLAFGTDTVVGGGIIVWKFRPMRWDHAVLSYISEASVGAGDLCAVPLPTPSVQVAATHDVR